MKKLFLFAIAMYCLVLNSFAQTTEATESIPESAELKRIRFGAFIAPSLSWMKPTAAKDGSQTQENGGSKMGFAYGLMADYQLTDNYTIATGLTVNSSGGKVNTNNPAAGINEVSKSSFNYSLQYIEIPVALKLKTDKIGQCVFFGQAGMSLGINIGKKATYNVEQKTGDTTSNTIKADQKEKLSGSFGNIAPILLQMNLGIGVQYAINKKLDAYIGLFFNNSFAPDITNPSKYKAIPEFKDGTVRLNNFALRMGFYF